MRLDIALLIDAFACHRGQRFSTADASIAKKLLHVIKSLKNS